MSINEVLLKYMSKTLSRHSPRNYANIFGVASVKIYTTDGFSALRWSPRGLNPGPDRSLKADLTESAVKYPNARALFPSWDDVQALPSAVRFINVMVGCLKPGLVGQDGMLWVNEGSIQLIAWDQNQSYEGLIFNAGFLMRNARGLPKDAVCTDVGVKDEILVLKFESSVGEWEIILCAVWGQK